MAADATNSRSGDSSRGWESSEAEEEKDDPEAVGNVEEET